MTQALLARRAFHSLLAATLVAAAGCTMKDQDAPPLTGPSEFALSIAVGASPDVLSQDGASQSLITVTARDANGAPLRNLTLRAEISVGGTAADFGSLSARNIVTGSDGRATVVYTAPVAPSVAVDNFTVVDIVVTPIGGDFNNTTTRSAAIRLVPPGVVIPPDGMRPSFTFTPTAPADHQAVLFDAGASQPQGGIGSYDWNFGDGNRGSGRTTSHEYSMAGTYVVTLTITDAYGRSASTSQAISVGAGTNPSAAFVFSPTEPLPGQQVNFNAAASVPAPGRTIVRYRWDFGDGSPSGSGVQAAHTYAVAGTYNVTLVVTDDAGRVGTATQSVSVGTGAPTADFTFSPTAPTAATVVNFTAAASTAAPGRTITTYFWSFGDGTTGSGVNVSKLYGVSGSFNVTLTVTDSQGQTATITKTVSVS